MTDSKVVPVTEDMLKAGFDELAGRKVLYYSSVELAYRAMRRAAPTPEPDALAESIIQTHGEHFAALLVKALEERL